MLDANERESRSITLEGPNSRQHQAAAAQPPWSRHVTHPPTGERRIRTRAAAQQLPRSYCHVADVNIS